MVVSLVESFRLFRIGVCILFFRSVSVLPIQEVGREDARGTPCLTRGRSNVVDC